MKVALAAVIEPGNDFVNGLVSTLSGDEHGKLAGNFILLGDGEGAVLAANLFFGKFDRDHGILAQEICARFTLINYGTISVLRQEDSHECILYLWGAFVEAGGGTKRHCAIIY